MVFYVGWWAIFRSVYGYHPPLLEKCGPGFRKLGEDAVEIDCDLVVWDGRWHCQVRTELPGAGDG